MSFQALSWAYGLSLGSAPQKAVLIYLAQFAHEDGTCTWPSVLNIQVATELGERAVRKALKDLQDKGLIVPGDQRHAALGKNGGTVPRGRRSKVWDLRLNMPVEEFNGVERAEDVRDRLREEERERKARERGRKHAKPQDNTTETASESRSTTSETEGCTLCTPQKEDRNKTEGCTTCTSQNDEGCTSCTSRGAPHAPNRLIQTINPSLPTGELPASGKRPTTGRKNNTRTTPAMPDEVRAVAEHLTAVRGKLALTTKPPTRRDANAVSKLLDRIASSLGCDRMTAADTVAAVIDWMPANDWWLKRIDSARRLASDWDRLRNDWTIAQRAKQRELDDTARARDRKPVAKPTPIPEHRPEPHTHTFACEHVLAVMRPHEAEYSHEGSMRHGRPSEWQKACQAKADELNRRDGVEAAA